jgi:hypothetical protein
LKLATSPINWQLIAKNEPIKINIISNIIAAINWQLIDTQQRLLLPS